MALANVKEYIDFLTDRFGANDAATRSRCLSWLQWAESELYTSREWWFRQVEASVALEAGTETYSLGVASTTVYQVRVGNGAPLSFLPPSLYREVCSGDGVLGAPIFWTQLPAVDSSWHARFGVYPRPLANGTATVLYLLDAKVLEDSEASESDFPEGHRMVVVSKALIRGYGHYSMGAQLDLEQKAFEQYFGALLQEDAQHAKAERL